MKKTESFTTLFVDIGGVLLTNGWDHTMREALAKTFHVDAAEMEERHKMAVEPFERGLISLDEYLKQILFYIKRPFSRDEVKQFIFNQSKPFPDMIEFISRIKAQYGFNVVAVNNEGLEINEYRIKKFQLGKVIDFFISSCFIQLLKPDPEIYKAAMAIVQAKPSQVLYLEDRPAFVQAAEKLGIASIQHKEYEATCKAFARYGIISISKEV